MGELSCYRRVPRKAYKLYFKAGRFIMPTDLLQKEIVGLGDEDINFLISIARFLHYRTDKTESQEEIRPIKRRIGFLSEVFVSIAPDFDETPDCLMEYV